MQDAGKTKDTSINAALHCVCPRANWRTDFKRSLPTKESRTKACRKKNEKIRKQQKGKRQAPQQKDLPHQQKRQTSGGSIRRNLTWWTQHKAHRRGADCAKPCLRGKRMQRQKRCKS